ncbi:unnamed protein product [Zymoseptoria tritici ST99CH_1E4]|uniref:Thioesterase domain-containing protein n=1 Tax=Zymoseptoria tritici ST99CH_1E4 TaxID=1276532 RepID=A0A2H1FZV7_ZYMTR|nr:unnamed protein product [Zymoseptoria tritici ST99CH_1E4]
MSKNRPSHPVPQSTIDHFSSIAYVQPTLSDPAFKILPSSRNLTHNGAGHTLMAKTWNTSSTIHQVLSFFRSSSTPRSESITYPEPASTRGEMRRFYTLGSDLNAHPNLLHGGVIAVLLDSTLGRAIGSTLHDRGLTGVESMFTVQLNVAYKKPVRTPGTVMVRAWVVKLEGEGRKVWAKGRVEGEGGVVHAEAEGMWVSPKEKKKEGEANERAKM